MTALSNNSLLLLIDLQKSIDHSSWGQRNNPDAEENIAKLLETWRSRNMPIIHVKHMSNDAGSHYRPGQDGNEFKEIVEPKAGEEILEKDTNSAFINTNLSQNLNERNISEIVIVGVITNNSIEATARMSGDLGFRTVVVSDSTFTFGKADYAGNWRSAEEVHNMSLANLSGEYAEIFNSSEVLNLLPVSS